MQNILATSKENSGNLILGIDASNIKSGGGLAHLRNLLIEFSKAKGKNVHIIVFISPLSLRSIKEFSNFENIDFIVPFWIIFLAPFNYLIHYFLINIYFKLKKIDIALNLGALPYFKPLVPFIVVSQNMLPFERSQISLFGRVSFMGLKLLILRFTQKLSFTKASGIIFLSQYAKKNISKILSLKGRCRVIPHGVEPKFNLTKRDYNKIKVLTYVSPFYPYKHQEELIKAFLMSKTFIGTELWLVGEYNNSYGKKLISKYSLLNNSSVRLFGNVKHENIQHIYQNSDIFAFPSSCENLPNILLEAMASGLPIICSEKGPMPDVLGRAGLYFNPYNPNSISRSFEKLVHNRRLRVKLSIEANKIAKTYSWTRCFEDTIDFCFEVLKK